MYVYEFEWTWEFVFKLHFCLFNVGVLLAVLERAEIIDPIADNGAGTVSAGYQNFLICIEMFFAAIALRYAFPYQVYAQGCVTDSHSRSVTMQSISSSLKVASWVWLICKKSLMKNLAVMFVVKYIFKVYLHYTPV